MSERVTVVHREDGTLAARKAELHAGERARLHAEAAMLRRARHPGVVTLLEEQPDALLLGWIGSRSLATHRTSTVGEVGALLAGVATTVADLHRIGITHGALDPSHVVLAAGGRPVLCGFALAEQASSVLDGRHRERVAQDVAGLGDLLDGVLREALPEPARRWGSRGARRSLERLADRARSEPPDRRPSARAFAAAVADATPQSAVASDRDDPRLPAPEPAEPSDDRAAASPDDSTSAVPADSSADSSAELSPYDLRSYDHLRPDDDPEPVSRPRPAITRRPALSGLLMLVAVGLVAPQLAGRPGPVAQPDRRPPITTAAAGTDTTSTSMAPPSSMPPQSAPVRSPAAAPDCSRPYPNPSVPAPDVDGDGCDDTVTVEGNVIAWQGRRWQVGTADDAVAVADWDCDGTATAALLDAATGDVFVFDDWSAPHGALEAPRLATVDDGTGLHPSAGRCPDLVVDRVGGAPVTIPMVGPIGGPTEPEEAP